MRSPEQFQPYFSFAPDRGQTPASPATPEGSSVGPPDPEDVQPHREPLNSVDQSSQLISTPLEPPASQSQPDLQSASPRPVETESPLPIAGGAPGSSSAQVETNNPVRQPGQPNESALPAGWERRRYFDWRRDLSEDGRKLYDLLLGEVGDADLLPMLAEEDEIDLQRALTELRNRDLIDESDPEFIRLRLFSRKS